MNTSNLDSSIDQQDAGNLSNVFESMMKEYGYMETGEESNDK